MIFPLFPLLSLSLFSLPNTVEVHAEQRAGTDVAKTLPAGAAAEPAPSILPTNTGQVDDDSAAPRNAHLVSTERLEDQKAPEQFDIRYHNPNIGVLKGPGVDRLRKDEDPKIQTTHKFRYIELYMMRIFESSTHDWNQRGLRKKASSALANKLLYGGVYEGLKDPSLSVEGVKEAWFWREGSGDRIKQELRAAASNENIGWIKVQDINSGSVSVWDRPRANQESLQWGNIESWTSENLLPGLRSEAFHILGSRPCIIQQVPFGDIFDLEPMEPYEKKDAKKYTRQELGQKAQQQTQNYQRAMQVMIQANAKAKAAAIAAKAKSKTKAGVVSTPEDTNLEEQLNKALGKPPKKERNPVGFRMHPASHAFFHYVFVSPMNRAIETHARGPAQVFKSVLANNPDKPLRCDEDEFCSKTRASVWLHEQVSLHKTSITGGTSVAFAELLDAKRDLGEKFRRNLGKGKRENSGGVFVGLSGGVGGSVEQEWSRFSWHNIAVGPWLGRPGSRFSDVQDSIFPH